jgi:hypothetical protein
MQLGRPFLSEESHIPLVISSHHYSCNVCYADEIRPSFLEEMQRQGRKGH